MCNARTLRAIGLSIGLACGLPASGDDRVAELLVRADAYRLPGEAVQVETEVTLLKDGAVHKQRRYTVMQREGRRSLVLMQSPAEKGQKVLMLGDDYWLILPKTQRPIRITPTQKLLGDASTGDIASMRWAGDYDGLVVGEEPCNDDAAQRCLHLSLSAQRKGVTYSKMELWLESATHEPVRADLYVASGKLAKRARFVLEVDGERKRVREMLLIDEIQQARQTIVRYLSRASRRAPDEWFNPMFLTRSEPQP